MIVSIMQPAYLPWLGYFDRIARSDLHIVLDHVAIDASSKTKFANRNRIRTPGGWCWLTVPLKSKGRHGELFLNDAEIDRTQAWERKHRQSLRVNYAKAPYFGEHSAYFDDIYGREWTRLHDLVNETSSYLGSMLGAAPRTVRSSSLAAPGAKAELILNLCREVGATTYISGPFGRDYLDGEAFAAAGIRLVYHEYSHPAYTQCFAGFEPFLSAVDLLFNHGAASSTMLRANQPPFLPQ